MYFLTNMCLLCLSNDQKFILQHNLSLSIMEILEYILPECLQYIIDVQIAYYLKITTLNQDTVDKTKVFQISKTPSLCENCLNSLENIFKFRQKCLENIKTYTGYVQELKQKDDSFKYPLIKITDIQTNQKCEILKDIQNVGKIKAETNLDVEIKSEIYETDYNNSGTGYDGAMSEQIVGKFEMVELHVKKEITEELIINENVEEDLNLSENEVPSSSESEFHQMEMEEKENELNPSNDEIKIDSQSLHSDTNSSDGRTRGDNDVRPYKCDICQKTFKRSFQLENHDRVHCEKTPFTCEICQKSFKHISSIKLHKRTHTGERPFKCGICQRSFGDRSHMKRHERTHSDVKPYSCDICQESFNRFSNMKRHQIIHSGKKPYSCDTCHRSFRTLLDMKRHKRPYSDHLIA